jgi:hypothetical protein
VFPVTIDRVSYIGADTHIYVQLADVQRFTIWEANTKAAGNLAAHYAPGAQAYLTWPAENALVLAE